MIWRALVVSLALASVACTSKDTPAPAADTPASALADPAAPATPPKAPAAKSAYPGTEAGAKLLLEAFLKPGADHAALSAALAPTKADYASTFTGDAAAKAEAGYAPAWSAGAITLKPKDGQTTLLLSKATGAELASGAEPAKAFPGGYAKIGTQLQPTLTFYRFKFVKPGETLGMAFDGLTFVNGRWVIFPKPWRVLR
jgi:hypothetical protein